MVERHDEQIEIIIKRFDSTKDWANDFTLRTATGRTIGRFDERFDE